MARIGSAHYQIQTKNSGAGDVVDNVQTFKLDINQNDLSLSTREIMVMVTKNYGAAYTCLYRVRMHGVPVRPHARVRED